MYTCFSYAGNGTTSFEVDFNCQISEMDVYFSEFIWVDVNCYEWPFCLSENFKWMERLADINLLWKLPYCAGSLKQRTTQEDNTLCQMTSTARSFVCFFECCTLCLTYIYGTSLFILQHQGIHGKQKERVASYCVLHIRAGHVLVLWKRYECWNRALSLGESPTRVRRQIRWTFASETKLASSLIEHEGAIPSCVLLHRNTCRAVFGSISWKVMLIDTFGEVSTHPPVLGDFLDRLLVSGE